ncbi:hypothetical protein HJC23_007644 [Cyclotella cryptica]|uniref:Protein kinase domain-containing protein n=1 Tax=Cyclotella cryptica TaxID=29204 RepID=A0ABD3P954_9STRA|eukprot:CCRYP_016882-RA/>CCRYP_016882-RA protein AED:0.08 eAED:0.08 QI:607/0.66/0.75/1/0.66/0.5/4/2441/773
MMKFSRASKKKQEKGRQVQPQSHHYPTDRSVSSAYSAYSDATGEGTANYSAKNSGGSHRYPSNNSGYRRSSAQSVASISSASVFAPSVAQGDIGGAGVGLQPSSSRTLHDLNSSRRSSLLTSIGTAASRTFRSYKMTLPKAPPPIRAMGSAADQIDDDVALESDLELLGRTVHAVSSALTEPPKEGDKFMIYDVSFNPKGCVWDALILVQKKDDEEEGDDHDSGADGTREGRSSTKSRSSRSRSRSRSGRSRSRSVRRGGGGDGPNGWDMENTFSFPIRVTCAEDDDYVDPPPPSSPTRRNHHGGNPPQSTANVRRAKTYAVDLSVVDDSPDHPMSRWTSQEAAEHRVYIKNAMEWVSFGIRRSMSRSMFPQFPEGCQGKPFREVYQLNKKLKSGTFSTVCRGVHRETGRQVAVKCILRKKIEPSVDAAVFEEVLIMSGLHHKYICPMIDYFEEDRCHFVVMELEKGGDLCERLNEKVTYSEQDARIVLKNICEAMEFVHNKGFAHCDIKPRNYLLHSKKDDLDIRLADFGFAQHVHAPNSLTSQCGTPFFLRRLSIESPMTKKLICGVLVSLHTSFSVEKHRSMGRIANNSSGRISCDDPIFPDDKWGHISDEAVDFVRKLLHKDPAKRLSASEALRHRWLADHTHHRAKTPSYDRVTDSSEDFSELTDTTKRSRDPPDVMNHHPNNALHLPTRSSSLARASSSRSSRPPPPPPPPQLARELVGTTSKVIHSPDDDDKARLLDVIKEQDAKIERLERMVKRMLEPDGAVHEC